MKKNACKAVQILEGAPVARTCARCGITGQCGEGHVIRVEDGQYVVETMEKSEAYSATQLMADLSDVTVMLMQASGDDDRQALINGMRERSRKNRGLSG